MMPIEPILQDIKKKLGTNDVRLPERNEIESIAVSSTPRSFEVSVDADKHNPMPPAPVQLHGEKRQSTDRRTPLQNHTSSLIQAGAPILGAVGSALDDEKRRDAAAIATVMTDTEKTAVESKGETEGEIAYLGNAQLAILIFGLCVATLGVNLGEWLPCYLTLLFSEELLSGGYAMRTRLKVQERLNNDPSLYPTDEDTNCFRPYDYSYGHSQNHIGLRLTPRCGLVW